MGLNTYPYNPFPASTDKLDEAHNEQIQAEIDQVKNDVTNLNNEIYGNAVVYPYASSITIENAVPSNLDGCVVKIEPVQSGSGDPSPENVRPITGHTEASVLRDGKNWFRGYYDYNSTTDYSPLLPNTQYTISAKSDGSKQVNYQYIYKDNSFGGNARLIASGSTSGSVTVTTPDNVKGINIYTVGISSASENIAYDGQVELGSTATPYVPYAGKTYTIALGDTIYGGTVDFDSGVMNATYRILSSSNTYTYTTPSYPSAGGLGYATWENTGSKLDGNGLCNLCAIDNTGAWSSTIPVVQISNQVAGRVRFYCDAADDAEFVSKYGNIVICYELATPTTIQLTPQQIQMLKGTNTLTASTGQISVTVNGVSGAIGSLQTQANNTDATLAELAADIAEQLPTAPTTDGAYILTVTVASGTPTYSWESAE